MHPLLIIRGWYFSQCVYISEQGKAGPRSRAVGRSTVSNGAYNERQRRRGRRRASQRLGQTIFPRTSAFALTTRSEIDFQNDYTGHGAACARQFPPAPLSSSSSSSSSLSSLQKGNFASPIFIRSARVILLFSRTIKFPVMARFRLSEKVNSPRGQAKNGLLECRKGRARA